MYIESCCHQTLRCRLLEREDLAEESVENGLFELASVLYDINSINDDDMSHSTDFADFDRKVRIAKLYFVVDYSEYEKSGKDANGTVEKLLTIVNGASSNYQKVDIFLSVVGIEIWETPKIVISPDPDQFVFAWNDYKIENVMPNVPIHDATVLVVLAIIDILRHKIQYSKSNTVSSVTLTHEIGHLFGLNHVQKEAGCVCRNPPCIMDQSIDLSGSKQVSWSSCSIDRLKTAFKIQLCLFKPAEFEINRLECGDGLVTSGEECDCGSLPEHLCSRECCDMERCKLTNVAECSTGLCCDLLKCEIKTRGTVCRASYNDCDLDDVCDGDTQNCVDMTKPDGVMCAVRFCQTRDQACASLWDHLNVKSATEECYKNNMGTWPCFHCDYIMETNKAVPCQLENVLCGRVLCNLEGFETIRIRNTVLYQHLNCTCAEIFSVGKAYNPGFVQDGTKCGRNRVCLDRKCISRGKIIARSDILIIDIRSTLAMARLDISLLNTVLLCLFVIKL
ncbi:hypothetical protein HELRODRAFT_172909 [Helobdella robusta]|uniref:Peptidase M12B domain-containing protein n=1 Tax=Helobdella robusta TaxID=6412 RepID=T1F643_HELRO|nr:hypothetical protein HELRODRAFT_172909 [Helobdella robusta]ESO03884.1 hypothetical protein HELRODRAFT_172909 [Helobdella robusta]